MRGESEGFTNMVMARSWEQGGGIHEGDTQGKRKIYLTIHPVTTCE